MTGTPVDNPGNGVDKGAKPPSSSASSSSAGTIGDALKPLTDALSAGAKTAATESPGDPKVIAAVKLGWVMTELGRGLPLHPLPEGVQLDSDQQSQAQVRQVTALLDVLKLPGLDASSQDKPNDAQFAKTLQVALVGADARLARAYGLGSGLRAMIAERGSTAIAQPSKILVDALDALSSDLPSHAARGVANSMDKWAQSTDAQKSALTDKQVSMWRSVIVGDKKGTELLEPGDYIDAAKELEKKYASRAVKSVWLWVLVIVAGLLFAGGIVYLLTAAHGQAGKVAAGVSGVVGALGLTWKGIGGTLGKLVAKLEVPLWGAELDTAVTHAITLSDKPAGPAKQMVDQLRYADRRQRALPLKRTEERAT